MSKQKFKKRMEKIADLEQQIAALEGARAMISALRAENRALKAQAKKTPSTPAKSARVKKAVVEGVAVPKSAGNSQPS